MGSISEHEPSVISEPASPKHNQLNQTCEEDAEDFKQEDDPIAGLDFDYAHTLLTELVEQGERRKRARELEIKERTGMSTEAFSTHRDELVRIFDFFQIYDSDHSGNLDHSECRMLLKHLGMQPYRPAEALIVDCL